MRWIIHLVVLVLLSVAEGSRLYEFYRILSGNPIAGAASAGVTVCIVFYLAYYGYVWTSRWATLICIVLSLASFVHPLTDELHRTEDDRPMKQLMPYPVYNIRHYWNGGGELYNQTYKLDTERVRLENDRILNENQVKTAERELSLYFWHLILGAVVLGVCVPILNYLVSHEISRLSEATIRATAETAVVASVDNGPGDRGDNATRQSDSNGDTVASGVALDAYAYATARQAPGDNDDASDSTRQDSSDNADAHGLRVSAADENRNSAIMNLFRSGAKATDLANRFDLSRQQIYKIVNSHASTGSTSSLRVKEAQRSFINKFAY